jgi:hypothetical protein
MPKPMPMMPIRRFELAMKPPESVATAAEGTRGRRSQWAASCAEG